MYAHLLLLYKLAMSNATIFIVPMQVKEKKYETVQTTSRMLESTLKIISQTSNISLGGGGRRQAEAAKTASSSSTAAANSIAAAKVSSASSADIVGSGGGSIVRIKEPSGPYKSSNSSNLDKVAPAEVADYAVIGSPASSSSVAASPLILSNGNAANGASPPPPPPERNPMEVPPLLLSSSSPSPPPPPHYASVVPQPASDVIQAEGDSSTDPLLSLMEAGDDGNVSIRFADETPR